MKKYIVWAVIILLVVALILAFTSGGNNLCSKAKDLCSGKCTIKAKVNGSLSGFFCRIGCLWDSLSCAVRSWF